MTLPLIDDATFEAEVLRSPFPVLVDFFTPACGPCKSLVPVLEEVAAAHQGSLRVVKVDVATSPETGGAYGVTGVPTLVLFHRGQERGRLIGFKPRPAIEQFLRSSA